MWKYIIDLENPMVQYIRDKKRNKKGVLVAGLNKENKVCFGWSVCNMKEDEFDFYEAFKRAQGRAYKNDRYEKKYKSFTEEGDVTFDLPIPVSIKKDVYWFIDRVFKYYKNNEKMEVVESLY